MPSDRQILPPPGPQRGSLHPGQGWLKQMAALVTKAVSRWWASLFGFVFPLLPSEFLLKTSTHVSAELKGKEFVQTIRKAEMGRPRGAGVGP